MKSTLKFLLYFFTTALALLAVLSIATRWILHDLSDYRPQIVELLQDRFHIHADIGDISAQLQGLDLAVKVSDLRIKASEQSAKSIAVAKAEIHINLLHSLQTWSPMPSLVRLSDASVQLRLDEQQQVHLPGLQVSIPVHKLAAVFATGEDTSAAIAKFELPHIRIDGLDIALRHPHHSDTVHFTNIAASYTPGEEALTIIKAQLPEDLGKSLQFELSSQGEAYLQADAIKPANVLAHFNRAPLIDGVWSFSARGTMPSDGNLPRQLSGHISAQNVRAPHQNFVLDDLKTDWVWQASTGERTFGLLNVSLRSADAKMQASRIGIAQYRLSPERIRTTGEVQIDEISQISPQTIIVLKGLMQGSAFEHLDFDFGQVSIHARSRWDHSDRLFFASKHWSLPDPLSIAALQDLAFTSSANNVALQVNLQDANIRYPKLPNISNLNAEITLNNDALKVQISKAQIDDIMLNKATLAVSDINDPYFAIQWNASGEFDDAFALLAEFPFVSQYRDELRSIKAQGLVNVQGDVGIPLKKHPHHAIQAFVMLDLKGAQMELSDSLPLLENINGRVTFTQEGAQGEGVTARLANHPLVISASAPKGRIVFSGLARAVPAATIAQLAKVPADLFKGSADVRADVILPSFTDGEQGKLNLTIHSDLKGLHIDAPAPFHKKRDQVLPFKAELMGVDGDPDILITYGGAPVIAIFEMRKDKSNSLQFFPARTHPVPKALGDAFRVYGRLHELPLSDWQQWWGKHRKSFANSDSKGDHKGDSSLIPAGTDYIDVMVDKLDIAGHSIPSIRIVTSRDSKQRLKLKLISKSIAGTLIFPTSQQERLYANMQRLHIGMSLLESTSTATRNGDTTLHPKDIPPISAKIKSLKIGNINLDNVRMMSRSSAAGLDLTRLRFEHLHEGKAIMKMRMTGKWLQEKSQDKSRLKFIMESTDYGRLLRAWGYSTGLRETAGKISGHFEWGSPIYDFDIANIDGNVALRLKDGRLRKVDVAAGKLLGLLNVSALARRFSADFSSLFRTGMTFKRFKGNLRFDSGNMYTDNLAIKGDGLNIGVSGRTGIVARDYDQEIYVVPNFSSGAPLAAALLGGPIAAAVAFLVDKTSNIGETIDEALTLRYSLTGSWEDPKMEFIEVPKVNPKGKIKSLVDDLSSGIGAIKDKATEGIKKMLPLDSKTQ